MRKPRNKGELYFNWLCRKVGRRESDHTYIDFLEKLNRIEFYGLIPNDDNRVEDGLELRNCFALDLDYDDTDGLNKPCSMLEMMIALAQRMDFILSDPQDGDQTAKWFWILVRNLGLEIFELDDPEANRKESLNNLIIKKFLERTYTEDGRGGLFPLERTRNDQRKVEIWYQMMSYIEEM